MEPTNPPLTKINPFRPTTAIGKVVGDLPTVTNVLQETLKTKVGEELGTHIYEASAKDIARMLSRKTRKADRPYSEAERDRLDNYDIDIDTNAPNAAQRNKALGYLKKELQKIVWPDTRDEKAFYAPTTKFLNACLDAWRESGIELSDKLNNTLNFLTSNKDKKFEVKAQDNVKGSIAPLKPDIAGIHGDRNNRLLWWNPPPNAKGVQIRIPVEVKEKFGELYKQAGTYSRCLFAANPMRHFALSLGFQPLSKKLYFLIYHRGGLTMSEALPLSTDGETDEGILNKILDVFLALMTWKDEEDAGIPRLFNGAEIHLPQNENDEEGALNYVCETLASSITLRGRACHVYRASSDKEDAAGSGPKTALFNRNGRLEGNAKTNKNKPDGASKLGSKTVGSQLTDIAVASGSKLKRKAESADKDQEPEAKRLATGSAPTTRQSQRQKVKQENLAKEAATNCQDATGSSAGLAPPADIFSEKEEPIVEISGRQQHEAEYVKPLHYVGETAAEQEESDLPEGSSSTDESLKEETEIPMKVVKATWHENERKCTEADVLHACSGKFGTVKHLCSFPVFTRNGVVLATDIFLDEVKVKVWAGISRGAASGDPENREYRTLWIHVSSFAGYSLLEAPSVRELFRAVFHGLLGWLVILQELYLHRDISIGNLLMLTTAMFREVFKLKRDGELKKGEVDWEEQYKLLGLEGGPSAEEVKEQVERLKGILTKLKIDQKCYGCVIDGDMACNLDTYFENLRGNRERSGTAEFMSPYLLGANDDPDYLQSPLDDLFSFYFVCQWAAVFHQVPEPSSKLIKIRNDIAKDNRERGTNAIVWDKLRPDLHGPFLCQCRPILKAWHDKLYQLRSDWDDTVDSVLLPVDSEGAPRAQNKLDDSTKKRVFCIRNFIAFAIRGVADLGEILVKQGIDIGLDVEA